MNRIKEIEQCILRLSDGDFQTLCNAYVVLKYDLFDITDLGGQTGTSKTTKGTPDAYIRLTNNNYIFLEYTTQQNNIYNKIRDDIVKCVENNNLKVSKEKIEKILYIHTSSNLNTANHDALYNFAISENIKLEIVGINQLAYEFLFKYPSLISKFLNLELDTGQILSLNDFIQTYNHSKLIAPLDTAFMYRENDLKAIEAGLASHNGVILYGKSGVGKTKLAIEYAKKYSKNNNCRLYCIKSNSLPLLKDIHFYIQPNNKYIIIIDDVNQISDIESVLSYISKEMFCDNIKVIFTIRDYLYSDFSSILKKYDYYYPIRINALNNDEIKEILRNSYGIKNEDYLFRILDIAKNNIRLCIFACILIESNNSINHLNNAAELYEQYYDNVINELSLNSRLLSTLGIIAYLEPFSIEHTNKIATLLEEYHLTSDDFQTNINTLINMELLDVFYNNIDHISIVKLSDQAFRDYLLKYVFCDKKIISLSRMIEYSFSIYPSQTINSVNTLINIFIDSSHFKYVEDSILETWGSIKNKQTDLYPDYIKIFAAFNPIETILYLRENNYSYSIEDNISIISSLSTTEYSTDAIDLILEYYLTSPEDLFDHIKNALTTSFSINKYSNQNNYNIQVSLFTKLLNLSTTFHKNHIDKLFFSIALHFLNIFFRNTYSKNHGQIVVTNIDISSDKNTINYRTIIWDYISNLSTTKYQINNIQDFLYLYSSIFMNDLSKHIFLIDAIYITKLFKNQLDLNSFDRLELYHTLREALATLDIFLPDLTCDNNSTLEFYHSLRKSFPVKYSGQDPILPDSILLQIKHNPKATISTIIDIFLECHNSKYKNNEDNIRMTIVAILNFIKDDRENLLYTMIYLANKKGYIDIRITPLISHLFNITLPKDIKDSLSEIPQFYKWSWEYSYYHELPESCVHKDDIPVIYSLFESIEDDYSDNIDCSLDFLLRYQIYDSNIIPNISEIILKKYTTHTRICELFLYHLFNSDSITSDYLLKIYKDNLYLLAKILFTLDVAPLPHRNPMFNKLLLELYLSKPDILNLYTKYLKDKYLNSKHKIDLSSITIFYQCQNYINIYDTIISIIDTSTSKYLLKDIFQALLENNDCRNITTKQNDLIKHIIKNGNIFINKCLFHYLNSSPNLYEKDYFILFIKTRHPSISDFKTILDEIIIVNWNDGGVGSVSYHTWKKYLESLISKLSGIEYIEYKKIINHRILSTKRDIIEDEQYNFTTY